MLKYIDHELFIDGVSAQKITNEYATPCFVYSRQSITDNWHSFNSGFTNSTQPYKIFFAVKANSNLSILKILAKLGAGFDCVSGGEIERVLLAGGKPQDIVFSGVGKSTTEITRALALGIHSINVESRAELIRIQEMAQAQGVTARIAMRINPNIAADTHAYIATGKKQDKFGIDIEQAQQVITDAAKMSNIHVAGVTCHIGSQITTLEPFMHAIDAILQFIDALPVNLEFINIGGGLGVVYKDETPPSPQEYVAAILQRLHGRKLTIHIEPGRAMLANAGVLLTRVEYIKGKFAIVDAAMNDIIRPALYQSYHEIIPVTQRDIPAAEYNVVGPICESGDFIGKNRVLAIQPGDLLAIKSAGAYCFSASSNYNTRPRAAEVLVDHQQTILIRKRETLAQLWENEINLCIV